MQFEFMYFGFFLHSFIAAHKRHCLGFESMHSEKPANIFVTDKDDDDYLSPTIVIRGDWL